MPAVTKTKAREDAEKYLISTLDETEKLSEYLDSALLWAARKIIDASVAYANDPMAFKFSDNKVLERFVNRTIEQMKEMLVEQTRKTLTFKDEEDNDWFPAILSSENNGKTFAERLDMWAGRFKGELEVIIASALALGYVASAPIYSSYKANLRSPWSNSMFRKAQGLGSAVFTPKRASYGVGQTTSAAKGLDILLEYVARRGFMENWFRLGRQNGAWGFRSFRTSTYPCMICDEQTKPDFHPITDDMPPYHPHCVCGIEFIYEDDVLI